jgi:DNA recombination protein RmuC
MTSEIIFLFVGLALGVMVVLILRRQGSNQIQYFEGLQKNLAERMDQVTSQMDKRLSENVSAINESKSFIAQRVNNTERTVREVSQGLGKLEQATSTLQKTNDEIASFQTMLRNPKVRGSFGEVLLNNLLADVLPQDRYAIQYTFSDTNNIADAIIRLQDGFIVAIDAKFPLANYEAYQQERDEHSKKQARKIFMNDIKKHVIDISKKYISPSDKTLDYAFMYIPVEGVYYETMVHDPGGESIGNFCLSHKVIPVSPNSFMAYLQTIFIGLRGMKIQEQAKEILISLQQVKKDFSLFTKDYSMIGSHLTNAKNRYDDSSRRLDKFTNRLDQIETGVETTKLKDSPDD